NRTPRTALSRSVSFAISPGLPSMITTSRQVSSPRCACALRGMERRTARWPCKMRCVTIPTSWRYRKVIVPTACPPASTFRWAREIRIRFRSASERLRYPPSRTSRSNAFRSGPSRDTPIRATGIVDLGSRKTPRPQEGQRPSRGTPQGLTRHQVEADHSAAIDNTTRKLLQEGKRPFTVGMWFSLGHSAIVFILIVALVVATRAIVAELPAVQSAGEIIGLAVSGTFLIVIGLVNVLIVVGIYRVFVELK